MYVLQLYECIIRYDEAVTRTEYLNYRSDYDEEVKQESLKKAVALLKNRRVMTAMTNFDKGRVWKRCFRLEAYHLKEFYNCWTF